MSLITGTSPHVNKKGHLGNFMLQVILATLPGLFAMMYFFGVGVLINVIIAVASALVFEAFVLKLRGRDPGFYLSDLSAVVTGLLIGLALPPLMPWWMTVAGTGFAIIFAKQLFGGLGSNPFNPAMVAYVLLLISYPLEMTRWLPANSSISISETVKAIFLLDNGVIDAFSGATPLDSYKTNLSRGLAKSEFINQTTFDGVFGTKGWEWANLGFLLGGIYLYIRKIINWHISLSFLFAITLASGLTYLFDPDHYASPLFHLFSGGTMLGAFFIATDPVSAATSNKGRLVYGFTIGILVYIIRTWGGYPDAVAFSVLLLNLCAPTIDYYTQPRTYGHQKANTGINKDN